MTKSFPLSKEIYSSKIVQDYLNNPDKLSPFLNMGFSQYDFAEQMENKRFSKEDRELLHDRILSQYKKANVAVPNSLNDLLDPNCYTVTTGHQLCLFGGPQYFIHKIVSTIKSAELLRNQHPDKLILPVFWMASEDHDFDEISVASIYQQKVKVEGDFNNGVGRLKTESFQKALIELKSFFENDSRGDEIVSVFSEAFQRNNWADATRFWVNHLFKDHGLIIVDGDDHELKKMMVSLFKKEVQDGFTLKFVETSNAELSKNGYSIQVKARAVNLFYFKDDNRYRIIKEGDVFSIGEEIFSKEQIIKKIDASPESFSPNALLRPLFQEKILPNIAYVGGPAEVNYWSQLKRVFNEAGVLFPKVMLRESFAFLSSKEWNWWESEGLILENLFSEYDQLVKKIIHQKELKIDTSDEIKLLSQLIETLKQKVAHDKSLESFLNAEMKKIENSLLKIDKKLVQSVKKKESQFLNKIKKVKGRVLKENKLIERTESFIPIYIELEGCYVNTLIAASDPFNPSIKLLVY